MPLTGEIDRADEDFEEFSSDYQVSTPQIGTERAEHPQAVAEEIDDIDFAWEHDLEGGAEKRRKSSWAR